MNQAFTQAAQYLALVLYYIHTYHRVENKNVPNEVKYSKSVTETNIHFKRIYYFKYR